MGRPLKTAAVDLADAQDLTAGLIERLQCPANKAQAFLRDRRAPTLRVRVTSNGAKSFVFEAKLQSADHPAHDRRCAVLDHRRGAC